MKQIKPNKKSKWLVISVRMKFLVLLAFLFILSAFLFQLAKEVNAWYQTRYFQFNQIVEVKFNKPVEVKERKVSIQEVIKVINEAPLPGNLTPIEEYICEKWGPYDCKIALAVAKAESGLKEDAIGINSSSVDLGIFQVNSVHFKKPGCSPKELFDAYKNVDCAYEIYKASGWSAWSVFSNNSFKNAL